VALSGLTLIAITNFFSISSRPILLAADSGVGGGLFQFLILFGPLFLVWYFLVILPQQRQRRKTQDMLANLKTGDRVLTSGGLYGTIVGFRENVVVQLQVAKDVRIDVARSAITGLQNPEGEAEASAKAAAKGKS
jgi:preprotein translocase subunit YajC